MGRKYDIEKRQDLAKRAFEYMRDQGNAQVTMSALARELGITRPALYHYFPDKTTILQSILFELLTEQTLFVMERVMAEEHPIDQLYAQIKAVHEFYSGREADIVFLTQTMVPTQKDEAERILKQAIAQFSMARTVISQRIDEYIERGLMKPIDGDSLVRLVRAVIDGLLIQRVIEDIPLTPIHDVLWHNLLRPLKDNPPGDDINRHETKSTDHDDPEHTK